MFSLCNCNCGWKLILTSMRLNWIENQKYRYVSKTKFIKEMIREEG